MQDQQSRTIRRTVLSAVGALAACAALVPAAHAVTLTPIGTPFNNPVGIDHHEPTNKLAMSVNYPSGLPYNFELVAGDGSRSQFSTVNGLTDELKIATVRSGSCQGGFVTGQLFAGNGVPGQIVRLSPDGSVVNNPWVALPGEPGLMRGGLFQDRYCVAGGDLVVVTTRGGVWRITSTGVATKLASLNVHLEGVTTLPNDPSRYGPWAGKIVAGAEQQGLVWTIDPVTGAATPFNLGIQPEDLDVIPDSENFFGVNYAGARLMGAPASEFCGMRGDLLIAQEFPGILWHVRWNGTGFVSTNVAQVSQWEHVTFSPAGLVEIPEPPSFTIDDVSVVEGDAGTVDATFTVTLSRSSNAPCADAASVHFATADGTAGSADYTSTSGTLNFGPGETTKTITVPVLGDTLDEPDETFFVNLSEPAGATIADPQGVGTILDDDDPPTISIDDTSVIEGDAGQTPATQTATLSAPSGQTITADWATQDGTAVAPGDYATASGTVTFLPGETSRPIVTQVQGDTLNEPDETYTVQLGNLSNVAPGDTTGTVTILDDERAGGFSCRATGLRTFLTGESAVANPPRVPCRDDFREIVRVTGLLGLLSGTVRASVINARTAQHPDDLSVPPAVGDGAAATANVATLVIALPGTTIAAEGLTSAASATCVAGRSDPELAATSRLARLTINGRPIAVGEGPVSIPLVVGTLHLNWTGRTPTAITRRALFLDLVGNLDVVAAESIADFEGNPCVRKRTVEAPR